MPDPVDAHADSDGMLRLARVRTVWRGEAGRGTVMDAFQPGMICRDPSWPGSGSHARRRTWPGHRVAPSRSDTTATTARGNHGTQALPQPWQAHPPLGCVGGYVVAGRGIIRIFSIADVPGMLVPVRVVPPDTRPAEPSRRQSDDRATNARRIAVTA